MKKTKKGFTLVELVIVVAVMAILVAVAIPTVSAITGTARKNVADTNAQTIESMIKLGEAEYVNSSSAAVDPTYGASQIQLALNNAKLGIEEGTFYYIIANGSCIVSESAPSGTQGTDYYKIVYTNGSATVN